MTTSIQADDANVWVLPDSKKLLVDQYFGVPVESCNWSESTKKYVQSLGLTGALYEFKTWNEALTFAQEFCKNNPSWTYDCCSPLGDLAAEISLDNY